jgi:hypothetical protein
MRKLTLRSTAAVFIAPSPPPTAARDVRDLPAAERGLEKNLPRVDRCRVHGLKAGRSGYPRPRFTTRSEAGVTRSCNSCS